MTDLNAASEYALRWLRELAKNGPDLRVNAHKKAAVEAVEFAIEGDLIEAADVFICLLGALDYQGYTPEDLANAVYAKTQINQQREWAQEPDGTWQHVIKKGV